MRRALPALLWGLVAGPALAAPLDPSAVVVSESLSGRIEAAATNFAAILDLRNLLARMGEEDGFVIADLPTILSLDLGKERVWLLQAVLRLDLDWDGTVTRAEYDWSLGSGNPVAFFAPFSFDEVDADADAVVTLEEARSWAAAKMTLSQYDEVRDIVAWDLDGDGTVSITEVDAVVWATRDRLERAR